MTGEKIRYLETLSGVSIQISDAGSKNPQGSPVFVKQNTIDVQIINITIGMIFNSASYIKAIFIREGDVSIKNIIANGTVFRSNKCNLSN